MRDIRVSVVIPTRNRSALLYRAVESVLCQELQPLEIIVVDDASDYDVAEHLPKSKSVALKTIRNERVLNGSGARNRGIDEARGNVISFLDSDDYWSANHLEKACESLTGQRVDFVFGKFYAVVDGEVRRELPLKPYATGVKMGDYLFAERAHVRTSTFVGAGEIVRKVRFDQDLEKHQDWDFALRAERQARVGFTGTPTVYIDHSSKARMSYSLNIPASAYFIRKNRELLTDKEYIGFVQRVVGGLWEVDKADKGQSVDAGKVAGEIADACKPEGLSPLRFRLELLIFLLGHTRIHSALKVIRKLLTQSARKSHNV